MATWVDKSFSLLKKGAYLDRLIEIYPAPPPQPRKLKKNELELVKKAFNSDDFRFLEILLTLEKFPFNDPYVSFLRKSPSEIRKNPLTVKRLCKRLRQMGINGVVAGLEEPKQLNRQMGGMFRGWLFKKYPIIKNVEDFEATKHSPVFLGLSGEKLRKFANNIGCGIQKQPDFIAKSYDRYIIGEAKFIGTEGGNQNRAFEDALHLASRSFKNAATAAILDGIVWIPESGQMSRRLSNFSGNALSALLIDGFLNSFKKARK
jgi:hypothetical protein